MISKGKDDFEKIALLYEFYGVLLPEKQYRFMSLYYDEDLSLSEISEETGVTRQAVHDGIKHAKESLVGYEEKLHMVEKIISVRRSVKEIDDIITDIEASANDDEQLKRLADIRKRLIELDD